MSQYVGMGKGAPSVSAGNLLEPVQELSGQEIYGRACVQCHGMREVQLQRKTADLWRNTVYSMISRGAPLMPDEIDPLTAYLAANYGPESSPPDRGTDRSQEEGTLPDEPGRAIFLGNCSACHSLEIPLSMRQSEAQWNATISEMVAYGANITPQEQEILVKYAAKHFGRR
jgi:mono/diheme cytochrome c family protein